MLTTTLMTTCSLKLLNSSMEQVLIDPLKSVPESIESIKSVFFESGASLVQSLACRRIAWGETDFSLSKFVLGTSGNPNGDLPNLREMH